MTDAQLLSIAVFPQKGAPGRTLRHATVCTDGLLGNRTKRHALLVATPGDVSASEKRGEPLRANVVVDLPATALQAAGGRELRIGDVVVRLDRKPSACDGMYADVVTPGDIVVGDVCQIV